MLKTLRIVSRSAWSKIFAHSQSRPRDVIEESADLNRLSGYPSYVPVRSKMPEQRYGKVVFQKLVSQGTLPSWIFRILAEGSLEIGVGHFYMNGDTREVIDEHFFTERGSLSALKFSVGVRKIHPSYCYHSTRQE